MDGDRVSIRKGPYFFIVPQGVGFAGPTPGGEDVGKDEGEDDSEDCKKAQ